MLRRSIFLLVFAGLFVLLCVGWALSTQALADGSDQITPTEPQIQIEISAFDPIPPPPPPPPRK